jgi:hypothetical protein
VSAPTSDDWIHLFTSTIRPLYISDALDLLASPAGSIIRFRYEQSYVEAGLQKHRQDDAVFGSHLWSADLTTENADLLSEYEEFDVDRQANRTSQRSWRPSRAMSRTTIRRVCSGRDARAIYELPVHGADNAVTTFTVERSQATIDAVSFRMNRLQVSRFGPGLRFGAITLRILDAEISIPSLSSAPCIRR